MAAPPDGSRVDLEDSTRFGMTKNKCVVAVTDRLGRPSGVLRDWLFTVKLRDGDAKFVAPRELRDDCSDLETLPSRLLREPGMRAVKCYLMQSVRLRRHSDSGSDSDKDAIWLQADVRWDVGCGMTDEGGTDKLGRRDDLVGQEGAAADSPGFNRQTRPRSDDGKTSATNPMKIDN